MSSFPIDHSTFSELESIGIQRNLKESCSGVFLEFEGVLFKRFLIANMWNAENDETDAWFGPLMREENTKSRNGGRFAQVSGL